MRAILKENTTNYISLQNLINVDFGKKNELPVSSIPQKKIAKMTAKMFELRSKSWWSIEASALRIF